MFKLLLQYRKAILVGLLLGLPVPVYSQTVRRTDTTPDVNRIRHAHRFTGSNAGAKIAAAIANLPSTGGTADARGFEGDQNITTDFLSGVTKPVDIIFGAATYSFTTRIILAGDDIRIFCSSGTIFKDIGTASGQIIRITGARSIISGCTLDANNDPGGPASGDNFIYATSTATDFTFTLNRVINVATGQYAVRGDGVNGATVEYNKITSKGPSISFLAGGSNIRIAFNEADVSSATQQQTTAIELKDTSVGGTGFSNITVIGNRAKTATGFCYEVGDWVAGGEPTRSVAVNSNHCEIVNTTGVNACSNATLPRACGGYSFARMQDAEFNSNTYYAVGQNGVDIAALEIVVCHRCTFNGNVIDGDDDTNQHNGITVNGSHGSKVSDNKIRGWGRHAEAAAIKVNTTSESGHDDVNDNVIDDNTIDFPTGTGDTKGIYVICNNTGGTAQRISIRGNHIKGSGNASTVGIVTYDGTLGSCTTTDNQIENNSLDNLATGVLVGANSSAYVGTNYYTSTVTTKLTVNGTLLAAFTPNLNVRRLFSDQGTALVAGDFSLSAGWGTTASIGSLSGGDQFHQFTVTSAGADQAANPTLTLTFQDGTWTTAPIVLCSRQEFANQPTVTFTTTTVTATTYILTFNGTPIAAETYRIACHVGGI